MFAHKKKEYLSEYLKPNEMWFSNLKSYTNIIVLFRTIQSSSTEPVATAWKKVISFSESDPDVLATKFSTLYKKMIDSPSFVYVGGAAAVQAATQNRCDVILVDDSNLPVNTLGVGVQTGSPLHNMVNERWDNTIELKFCCV